MRRQIIAWAVIALGLGPIAQAETVPPLLANFPISDDSEVQSALAERIRASFPQDIVSSTLSALLEMDGFEIENSGETYRASFVDADFPCIIEYWLAWRDDEDGGITGLTVSTSKKCV